MLTPSFLRHHARVSIEEGRFRAGASAGEVGYILDRPENARSLLVLGHSAGAGMRHIFMEEIARALAAAGIASFRYQFPYMEGGRARPDPPTVLHATVRAAVETAHDLEPSLPLFAGGKSMGGRMTSLAASRQPLPGVRGLIFFGFPLHAAGSPPSVERSQHLDLVSAPMLFLQGTRDSLADLDLMRSVIGRIGERATLHIVEGADHSFHVLKRSGRNDDEVLTELAGTVESWTRTMTGS